MLSKIKDKLNKPVTNGIAFKIIVCIDIIVLIACIRIANVRTTQDEEMQNYINELEQIIEKRNNNGKSKIY